MASSRPDETLCLNTVLSLITLLGFLFSLSACQPESTASGTAAERIRIQFDWLPEPEFGGFYAARQLGLFEKRQLDVDLRPGTAGTPVLQMVASGQVEFGVSGADDLLIARDHGIDVVPIYAAFKDCPLGLMLHAERAYNDVSDLFRTGTLAMIPGSTPLRFLERKYPFSGVRLVPTGNNVATFMHDPLFVQQCFITSEPVVAEAQGTKVRVILFKDLGYNPYAGVVFTRRDYYNSHPAQIKALTEALRSGWQAYQAHPEPAMAEMHQLNPTMSMDTFQKATSIQEAYLWSNAEDRNQAGTMIESRWQALGKTLLELGLIQKPVNTVLPAVSSE